MPPDIEAAIARNRRMMLSAIEGPMVRILAADYSRILGLVERESAALLTQVAAQGGEATISQVIASRQYEVLHAQIADEMRAAALRTGRLTTSAEQAAMRLGLSNASALMAQVAVERSALRIPATQRVIASLYDPSPLVRLVRELPGQSQAAFRSALTDGVARGQNPRVTARAIRRAVNMPASRALTVARTETHRAYRGAALEAYRANDDIIEGWVWISARDTRTCSVCWAMHGEEFPLDEPLASHPNCRCSQGPMPRTRRPDLRPDVGSGEESFAALSAAEQRSILGPGRYDAYQDGVPLSAMVGYRRDPEWGGTRFERPLSALRRGRAA